MDPVSRRLAAAAMGVVFDLSREEELEKTRLDLERARMEREDFPERNRINSKEIYESDRDIGDLWGNLYEAKGVMAKVLRKSPGKPSTRQIKEYFLSEGYNNDDVGREAYDGRGYIDVGLGDHVSDVITQWDNMEGLL